MRTISGSNQASLAEMDRRLISGGKAVSELPERQQAQQHTILSQSSVDTMRTLLLQLQNRRTELLTRYTPTDRLVIEVDHEIADTNASLNNALAQKGQEDTTDVNPAWQRVKSSLVEGAINRQAFLGRGEALRRSLADLQGRLAQIQSLDLRFNALQEQATRRAATLNSSRRSAIRRKSKMQWMSGSLSILQWRRVPPRHSVRSRPSPF